MSLTEVAEEMVSRARLARPTGQISADLGNWAALAYIKDKESWEPMGISPLSEPKRKHEWNLFVIDMKKRLAWVWRITIMSYSPNSALFLVQAGLMLLGAINYRYGRIRSKNPENRALYLRRCLSGFGCGHVLYAKRAGFHL